MNAFAGADSTEASVTVLTNALDIGFELLADIVQKPAFAADEIERWRRQSLSSLQVAYRDPEYLRDIVGQRVAYGDHPYAYPTDGFPSTVKSLTRDDVAAFHQERYTPSGSFVAVAGDITPALATELVRKHFGAWKGAAAPEPKASAPVNQRRIVVVDQPEAVQTQFGMFGTAVARKSSRLDPAAGGESGPWRRLQLSPEPAPAGQGRLDLRGWIVARWRAACGSAERHELHENGRNGQGDQRDARGRERLPEESGNAGRAL